MIEPFSVSERSTMLQQYGQMMQKYNRSMAGEDFDSAESQLAIARNLEDEYFSHLSRLPMGCCPFDGRPLYRTFDPVGLDGLWWRSDATPEEAPTCPHFCVLLGAVNFAGHEPHAGDFDVHPGPQVPYVIPRLLEHPSMIAVIAQIDMENGYLAYPIAYFAERRPPPQDLTAGWARTNFVYTTQFGQHGWRIPDDPWDFDLRPWLEQGKIRWCPPDSDNTVLSDAPPDQCPYLDLPGQRQPIIVQADRPRPTPSPQS